MANFAIDGIEMPKPSDYITNYKPIYLDSERLPGNGKFVATYLTSVYETTWTYKYLNQEQFDKLFAHIKEVKSTGNIYHTVTTIDSNTGEVITYEFYVPGDFTAPLYRIKNGVRYYRDVKFVFIGRGGDEA